MSANYTNLLMRQLNKYLKSDFSHLAIQEFLEAVNRSYEHYDRDNVLAQRSLEISTRELNQMAMENAEKEKRIRALLDIAIDGVLIIKSSGELEMCNIAASKLIGSSDLKNKSLLDLSKIQIIHSENTTTPPKRTSLAQFLKIATGSSLSEIYIVQPNDILLPVELTISEPILNEKELRICMLRNILERKQSEKKIALRHLVTRLLLESTTLQDAAPKILSTLCIELGWDKAIFWLLDPKEQLLRSSCVYTRHLYQDAFLEKLQQMSWNPSCHLTRTSWETKNAIFIPNILEAQDCFYLKDAKDHGLQSYISIPAFYENKIFGLIELFSETKQNNDPQLIKILHDIGGEMGLFIEHFQIRQREVELQNQLVDAARETGKMQVAASVLHNVGNVLNSINASVTLLQESLSSSELNNLSKVSALLQQHHHDLSSFIQVDEKGKLLPSYFVALAELWGHQYNKFQKEIQLLFNNVDHIKKIIKLQQSYTSVGCIGELASINRILDELIVMNQDELRKFRINIQKQYVELPEVVVDKTHLLQILINIIQNGIDALKGNEEGHRTLGFQTELQEQKMIVVKISDNGSGIDPVCLQKIFNFGFTTKKEGHGFGLHSSALLAQAMGGSLTATSLGKGQGATFILTLPLTLKVQEKPLLKKEVLV